MRPIAAHPGLCLLASGDPCCTASAPRLPAASAPAEYGCCPRCPAWRWWLPSRLGWAEHEATWSRGVTAARGGPARGAARRSRARAVPGRRNSGGAGCPTGRPRLGRHPDHRARAPRRPGGTRHAAPTRQAGRTGPFADLCVAALDCEPDAAGGADPGAGAAGRGVRDRRAADPARGRALALAALAPGPGQLLWDIGAGSGSIDGIEWMAPISAAAPSRSRPVPDRADRLVRNATGSVSRAWR